MPKRLVAVLASALALLAFVVAPLDARPVNIPSGNPLVSVDIPGGWKTSRTSRGLEVKSPDEEVFFWVEVYVASELAAVRSEHETYFAKQGVKPSGAAVKTEATSGDVRVVLTDLPATWNGKPTVLRYLFIDPNVPAKSQILLSYWASPDGDKTHKVAMDKIIASLGAPK